MKKLYRSRRDKKLFGLCGGIAEALNVDATLLRILLIVLTVFSGGAVIIVYILAGLVVPSEPPSYPNFDPRYGHGPYNNGYQGGYGSTPPRQPHNYGGPYAGATPPQPDSGAFNGGWQNPPQAQPAAHLDGVMDDLEKKVLRREIEELRAKLAKYEKGE
ncbi:PspC domain-containing protein [Paenibacillus aurantiacus]|uniref:PspC domain-containing protein n=1 Tax=Paenibacillus aurantiacus TaxID=1936118 RepID=A0ABV5KJ31_9BACL